MGDQGTLDSNVDCFGDDLRELEDGCTTEVLLSGDERDDGGLTSGRCMTQRCFGLEV